MYLQENQSVEMKSDAQMKNDVMEELLWDTTVKSRDITVRAYNGVVTLSGTVSNLLASPTL